MLYSILQEVRNSTAHMTKTELNENEFQDQFQDIIEAVNLGFDTNEEAHQKWIFVLKQIESDKIADWDDMNKGFPEFADIVRRREAQTAALCCCCCLLVTTAWFDS